MIFILTKHTKLIPDTVDHLLNKFNTEYSIEIQITFFQKKTVPFCYNLLKMLM